jgi:outer membrane protein TolC
VIAVLAHAAAGRAAIYELTLDAAVDLALQQSPAAARLRLEEERSSQLYHGVRRGLAPDLSFDLVAPDYSQVFAVVPLPSAPGDTVVLDNGEPPRIVYGKSTTTNRNASGALQFRQLLPWRGAFSANGSVYYRDEKTTPPEIRAPRRDYTVNAGVGIDVPLWGDDPVRRALHRADVEWEQAHTRARADRAQVVFQATSSYLELLRARQSLDIVRAETDQATAAFEVARRKVAAGLLADVDRLKLEVYRAQRQARLTDAETRWARAGDEFKLYLGLAPGDSLVLSEPLAPFTMDVDVDSAVDRALAQRTELGLLQDDLELLEIDRAARRAWRPEVDLAVRYGGSASETALDAALRSLSANDLSLRLAIHVPLWDSGRLQLEDAAEQTNLSLNTLEQKTTRDRIELEVRDAARQLGDARRRYEILAASTSLAGELLRISNERFERGLIDTQTYLGAQTDAAAAHLEATSALLDLYQARARLRFVTLEGD